jgi:hypothetical protein
MPWGGGGVKDKGRKRNVKGIMKSKRVKYVQKREEIKAKGTHSVNIGALYRDV